MLDDLLTCGLVAPEEHEIYVMFACTEIGKKWFDRNVMETFMDQPSPLECRGEAFAYADGRRSVFRDIYAVIEKINQLLKDESHDGSSENSG